MGDESIEEREWVVREVAVRDEVVREEAVREASILEAARQGDLRLERSRHKVTMTMKPRAPRWLKRLALWLLGGDI